MSVFFVYLRYKIKIIGFVPNFRRIIFAGKKNKKYYYLIKTKTL
ncbi:hypothetical protein HMPREF0653_01399 [Prevotella disiens JCM 6334 = ATCC 29426]|jgi:hypothetical protein|uniref:Uncharacterized protein n=1 Tax=Prevotella disiens JCM 6334 = ATCC 29426 TaxID=1235811 RepID=A0ABP2Y818_9BACT|nr:hypothetical protein HMPREF0653_01399 [Prevotella disiens JCM 6334 = ATCC 29426]